MDQQETLNTQDQTTAPVWAVVELMGHVRYGGQVSKDNQLGTPLLRVDVPRRDGSIVTQFINPQSIYRLTMCEERIARAAAEMGDPMPIHSWELPRMSDKLLSGAPGASDMKATCPECSTVYDNAQDFCPNCNEPNQNPQA